MAPSNWKGAVYSVPATAKGSGVQAFEPFSRHSSATEASATSSATANFTFVVEDIDGRNGMAVRRPSCSIRKLDTEGGLGSVLFVSNEATKLEEPAIPAIWYAG